MNEHLSAEELGIDDTDFAELFKSAEYENGLVIMLEMHKAFIPAYEGIKVRSEQIIGMIHKELKS